MNLDHEISRLLDIMPASGRMTTKIISKPPQTRVIDAPFPVPWRWESRPIYVNFDLWRHLSRGERDLVLLREVSRLTQVRWFKPDLYQGIALAGLIGGTVEMVQADALGMIVAGGLSAIACRQIWISHRSVERELEADEAAIKVAQRRGYGEVEAAQYLLSSITAIAQLEGHASLGFTELIRSQHLKSMANLSPVGVPTTVRQQG